jgi:hypothetical protein
MATAAKFVQPIPILLAYLVPLSVDVVPIKFHQFLFGASPRLLSGDVLLLYVSFSLLLLRHPERSRVTYCYSTFLFHYYYYSSTYFCPLDFSVSSISVRRVTCYDHFCVFQFFSIVAVSMATAAILKKSTLTSKTSHGNTVQRILLKLDTKIDHHSKLCSLFLRFSKWLPI